MKSIKFITFPKPEVLVVAGIYGAFLTLGLLLTINGISVENALKPFPPVCLFRNITGFKCPGCGMTHAFLALSQGHWREAVSYHPFSPLLFLGGIAWLFYPNRQKLSPSPAFLILSLSATVLFGILRNL